MKMALQIICRFFLQCIIGTLISYIVWRLYNYVNDWRFSVAFIGGGMAGAIIDSIKFLPENN